MSTRRIRPLGDVLTFERDQVALEPDASYRLAGVYSFGRGLFERPSIIGADTAYASLFRLHEDQLVLSRLNGWEGAVDIVEPRFAGCLVSNEYPTFAVDRSLADPRYLKWIARWPSFWEQLVPRGSMVRRKRATSTQLLQVEIPLPSLAEQRRLATMLDAIRSREEVAARLMSATMDVITALGVSLSARADLSETARRKSGWRKVALGSAIHHALDSVVVEVDRCYPNLGIYSFGRGLFAKPDIEGGTTSAKALNRVHAGQFIYSRLFAFEGAYGVVTEEFNGHFVSAEFPTFEPDPDLLDSRWLAAYLRTPARWAELASGSKGLGGRRRRVPVETILEYEIWLPPVEEQRATVGKIERLSALTSARAEQKELMKAMTPSTLDTVFAD